MKVFEKRVEVYLGHTRPIIDHFSSIRKKQSIIQTDELGNWIDAKKYDDIVRKVVKDILRHEPSHISKDKTKVSAAPIAMIGVLTPDDGLNFSCAVS